MTERSSDYSSPPTVCETLAVMVARFGGSTHAQPPVQPFDVSGPITGAQDVRVILGRRAMSLPVSETVTSLPGGLVFGAGVVLAPDGGSIARDVSLDFGKSDDTHWLLHDQKMRSPQVLAGKTAVVASALGEGYSHWLLDELPRLLLLKKEDKVARIITHANAAYAQAALRLYGWTGEVVEPVRRGYWQCEELIVPSLTGWTGRATARQIQLINEFVKPLRTSAAAGGERIYISRSLARRRRVTNEDEVTTALTDLGFVTVRLEELTWPEQIQVFRQAKVIVGPHGAGLANLAFCQSGTLVVELFGRDYLNGCFWQIAALRGLDYVPVVSAGRDPLGCDPRNNRLDFTVDLERLRAALT
jgi:capsular polysaccharide biosynthesis protein